MDEKKLKQYLLKMLAVSIGIAWAIVNLAIIGISYIYRIIVE